MPKVTVICYTRSQPWGYGHHPRGSRMEQRIRVNITRPLISTQKVQFSQCLLYWNQGVTYCTCGHLLVEIESSPQIERTKTGCFLYPALRGQEKRCHGARHGKTKEQKEYHIAFNAWKRCCKKVDSQGDLFAGIHDRYLRDPVYRESQLAIGWTEQKCTEMDDLAKQNHT